MTDPRQTTSSYISFDKEQDYDVSKMMVFTGNANPALAERVAERLDLDLGQATVSRFSDGEVSVEIQENVRGKDVFIVQSTCAPTNDNLMELMVFIDAIRRASATRITAVIPYFGYARQDRRPRSARVPISAKVVATMLTNVGVDRVLTVDLHADQIQGFFDIPVDNVYGSPVLLDDINDQNYDDVVVVSPDIGGVVRARAVAKQLDTDLAIIDKRRERANESQVMNLIGDVEGRTCILVDDMCDTAGTLCKAAAALKEKGAKRVVSYITHPVFSGPAIDNIANSQLDEMVVTDSIPLSEAAKGCSKIRQLSLAPMLAEAVRRVCNEESISAMFR
jgi:ribose-phosphate pyrophosphokinase